MPKSNRVMTMCCPGPEDSSQGVSYDPHSVSSVMRLARYPLPVGTGVPRADRHSVVRAVTTNDRRQITILKDLDKINDINIFISGLQKRR